MRKFEKLYVLFMFYRDEKNDMYSHLFLTKEEALKSVDYHKKIYGEKFIWGYILFTVPAEMIEYVRHDKKVEIKPREYHEEKRNKF